MNKREQMYADKQDRINKIIGIFQTNEELIVREVAEIIGLSTRTVWTYLKELVTKGILEEFQKDDCTDSRKVFYFMPKSNKNYGVKFKNSKYYLEKEAIEKCKSDMIKALIKVGSGRINYLVAVLPEYTKKTIDRALVELIQDGSIEGFKNSAQGGRSIAYKIKLQDVA